MTTRAATSSDLADSFLAYLEEARVSLDAGRMPDDEHDEAWEAVNELSRRDPPAALQVLLDVTLRCAEEDLPLLGAGALTELLRLHPELTPRFAQEIGANDRFFKAFQYVTMTGVPLDVQQRINDVLRERGVDPKYLVEYDETSDDD